MKIARSGSHRLSAGPGHPRLRIISLSPQIQELRLQNPVLQTRKVRPKHDLAVVGLYFSKAKMVKQVQTGGEKILQWRNQQFVLKLKEVLKSMKWLSPRKDQKKKKKGKGKEKQLAKSN